MSTDSNGNAAHQIARHVTPLIWLSPATEAECGGNEALYLTQEVRPLEGFWLLTKANERNQLQDFLKTHYGPTMACVSAC